MDTDRLCMKCMQNSIQKHACTYCGAVMPLQQSPAHGLPLGIILHGRYLIGMSLGHGGFGITYISHDLQTGKRLAIKEYMPAGLCRREPGKTVVSYESQPDDYLFGKKRFLREAQLIYQLRSVPNIVRIEKLFEENATAYYVMEYLEGSDLKKLLVNEGGKISMERTMRYLSPICTALSQAHANGIIHRDISPDNIFICSDGTVKLLDFGAAHMALGEKSSSFEAVLKRGYAPIEQYSQNGQQGAWTDIYALGCTIYRCITGDIPPESTNRLTNDELVPPSRRGVTLKQAQEDALLKAMAVRKEQRYQTVTEFLLDIGEIPSPPPPAPLPPPPLPSRNRYWYKRVLAGCIDLFIFAAFVLILYGCKLHIFLSVLLGWLAWIGINTLMEREPRHATVGKLLLHLQIESIGGRPLTSTASLLRNLLKGVLLPAFILDGAIAYADPSRQSLHCRLSGSLVTEADAVRCSIRGVSGAYGDAIIPVANEVIRFGRDPQTSNVLFAPNTPCVSGRHCEIRASADCWEVLLIDVGSRYGTFVNDGPRMEPNVPTPLHAGDRFRMGDEVFEIIQ